MTQLRNKFNIDDSDDLKGYELKTLPNDFEDDSDELSLKNSFLISLILHPLVFLLAWLFVIVAVSFNLLHKPELKPRDIEFTITQSEAPPINKNTKFRSDKNSRAGGIHDPNRKVSAPRPQSAPAKQAVSSAPSTPKKVQQPKKQPAPVQKPVQKQQTKPQQTQPKKPQPVKAPSPSVRPSYKPTTSSPRAQAPKITQKPKSPFAVPVPKSSAPVGPAPSFGSGSSKGSTSSSSSSSSRGSMPAPQFSASKPSSSSTASRGSQGSKGSSYSPGNIGNPGPGNPSGPPGIDAIKSPNWGAYMRDVEARIGRNWNPPKGDQSKRVVLSFKIGRDGRLLSIKVLKSSGTPLADAAAKAAVQLSAPFKPLPPEYRESSIDVDFTFDYNVLGATYR